MTCPQCEYTEGIVRTMPNLKPIVKKTVVDEIINSVVEMAKSGKIQPGNRFPSERTLADQWQVSRASVSEAMRALAFSNIVTIKPGDGIYLNEIPFDAMEAGMTTKNTSLMREQSDLLECLKARRALEGQIAQLAAIRATEEDIATLQSHMDKMLAHLSDSEEDLKIYVAEDFAFHQAVAQAAQNPYLYKAINAIWQATHRWIYRMTIISAGRAEITSQEHSAIFGAIKERDPAAADRAVEIHLQRIMNRYQDYFDTQTQEKNEPKRRKKSQDALAGK